jgi:exodeoxyribonuclease-5
MTAVLRRCLTLSADQQAAHDQVVAWAAAPDPQTLTLGGYAGTGKTSTIAQIVASLRGQRRLRIAFCCFTGKAALVLCKKLEGAGVLQNDYCGTIHSLIYQPRRENGKVIWVRVDRLEADLIVLDEASMVDDQLYKDLCSYDLPILAVGDHGQLPPVSGALNLMASPAIRLERIHRQAEGNPIVQMSLRAREGKGILSGDYGAVRKVPRRQLPELLERYGADFDAAGMVLCGTNATRASLNRLLRRRRGFESDFPMEGERVICLRNKRDAGLFNGLTGSLTRVVIPEDGEVVIPVEVALDGGESWYGDVRVDQFGAPRTIQAFVPGVELFDWGYALTVHKAQGSEAPNVVVFEECAWMETEDLRRRWRYTAYTRAAEKLLIIG